MNRKLMMSMDEANELIRNLDERIDELRAERDEARGVAARLLDGMSHDRAAWLHDFPWLKEYLR